MAADPGRVTQTPAVSAGTARSLGFGVSRLPSGLAPSARCSAAVAPRRGPRQVQVCRC